jgi:hypothetical protein
MAILPPNYQPGVSPVPQPDRRPGPWLPPVNLGGSKPIGVTPNTPPSMFSQPDYNKALMDQVSAFNDKNTKITGLRNDYTKAFNDPKVQIPLQPVTSRYTGLTENSPAGMSYTAVPPKPGYKYMYQGDRRIEVPIDGSYDGLNKAGTPLAGQFPPSSTPAPMPPVPAPKPPMATPTPIDTTSQVYTGLRSKYPNLSEEQFASAYKAREQWRLTRPPTADVKTEDNPEYWFGANSQYIGGYLGKSQVPTPVMTAPSQPVRQPMPVAPAVPVAPAAPTIPATPTIPAIPGSKLGPSTPAIPAQPAVPVKPVNPTVPKNKIPVKKLYKRKLAYQRQQNRSRNSSKTSAGIPIVK